MKKVILLLSMLALLSPNLTAQWVSTSGPNEVTIESFNVNGTTIFAGSSSYGGIYRSTDSGTSWEKCNTGLTYKSNVNSFCNIGTKIVVSTYTDILISSNNGDSWQKITPVNNQGDVRGLGYDGTYLYATIVGVGVARSNDEGLTWTISSSGISDKVILTLFATSNKLFIGTNTGGVFSSTDKGSTWQEANTGITNKNGIRSFAINGTSLFVASYFDGVYQSIDNGLTWSKNGGLSTSSVRRIFSFGTNLFVSTDAGIYKSTNQGTSWSAANNGITTNYSNNFVGVGNNLFVAVTGRGIYKSVNNGDQWNQSNGGITNSTIKTLVRSGSNLFAGAYYSGGVHYTNNGGVNWNSSYPSIAYVVQLVNNNNEIYAATNGWGLYKTTDNCATWTRLSTSLTNQKIYSVAVNGTKIFVGTDNSGVYSTIDNGTTWNEVNNGLTNKNINMLTLVGNNLFAATTGGVFISVNSGTSWLAAGLAGKNIITVKANNNKIFAGTWGEGVYVSLDDGTTWAQIKNGMTSLNIFALAFDNNNNIYAAAAANVYSSKDGGANWVLKNEGLPYEVYSIEVVDNYLYAGTNQYGVWKRPLNELVTDVDEVKSIPGKYSLEQNYPNPFNPSTTISYSIPTAGYVTLKVYDVVGREVSTLVNEYKQAGAYNYQFSIINSSLSSGVYFYMLTSGNNILTKKFVLTK
ncbi:MAG: T9SS type A sorting domain-containing protein [Melioribacteraceae bacterium]